MEHNGITEEELKNLCDIENSDKWERIDRYFPETRYSPKNDKIKTGVIGLPPKREKPLSDTLKMYTVKQEGKTYLLRTDVVERFSREGEIAAFADRVFSEGGVYVSSPIEVGAFCGDTMVYSIYNFFCGENLARRLPEYPTSHQLSFGIEAGKQLKKLHSILPGEEDSPNKWADMFLVLTRLNEKGIKYEGFEQASEFMKKYHALPENRPVTAVHGSFSANSLFLDKDLNVGVLPLQDFCWDDPITDLITLPDGYSMPFVKGVFKGLYEGELPKDFFELLCFYSTLSAISDIDSAENKEDLNIALLRAKKLAKDYDNYQSVVPSWY